MAGELEESKALLEAAVRGQRQVEQELSDTREQMSDMQGKNCKVYLMVCIHLIAFKIKPSLKYNKTLRYIAVF